MKIPTPSLAIILALSLTSVMSVHATQNVDEFTLPVTSQTLTDMDGVLDSSNVAGLGTTTISGERTITAHRLTGGGNQTSTVDTSSNTFNVSSDTSTTGIGTLEWNFSPNDLTSGSATAFQFNVLLNDNGASVTMEVESASGISTFTTIIAVGNTGSFLAAFTAFSGAADFTAATRINIAIQTNAATDFSMQTLLTTEPHDFGDAPMTYCTLEADNGPKHTLSFSGTSVVGPLLGGDADNVDPESDAAPSSGADGDDTATNPANVFDDENGLSNVALEAGSSLSSFDLTISGVTGGNPNVNAWIDFNNNGTFEEIEQVLENDTTNGNGTFSYFLTPPADAVLGNLVMRIRISTDPLATTDGFKGSAADGEVEDHLVLLRGYDQGDAPDTYKTLIGGGLSDGPFHEILSDSAFLGSLVDPEADGIPSVGADGDDLDGTDDEDGVSGIPALITTAGGTFPLTITFGGATNGDVYAWADQDQDGTFGTFDNFIGTLSVVYGPNPGLVSLVNQSGAASPVNLVLPSGLTAGVPIYVRFRVVNTGHNALSSATEVSPADNGEVEDYVIQVVDELEDWGDAPESGTALDGVSTNAYETTSNNNGPHHPFVDGSEAPFLGSEEDAETDGQPNSTATGDDTTDSPDDEDGVDFVTNGNLLKASSYSLPITDSGSGNFISAWIDFNGNGVFEDDTIEEVLDDAASGAGTYSISVPASALAGTTYARVRISSVENDADSPTGAATDGEVEDYQVTVVENLDFSDAPESGTSPNGSGTNNYKTTLTNDGPRHTITGPRLGSEEDPENDGQPNSDATGDDTTDSPDDEDGVVWAACGITDSIDVTITVSGESAKVNLWVDLNGDGDFEDTGEHIIDNVVQAVGPFNYTDALSTPATFAGTTFSRVRIVAAGDPDLTAPTGAADSGEVEDDQVTICADYGDLPDDYCTALADDGARHIFDVEGPRLGSNLDAESDANVSTDALGDDGDATDDEDGITFTPSAAWDTTSGSNSLTVTIQSDGPANLDVWIDWNNDDDFDDTDEHVLDIDSATSNTHSVTIPGGVSAGSYYLRARLYSSSSDTDSPCGLALDGEVEDYVVNITTSTLVELLSFEATTTENDQAAITWVTGAEIDSAGFNLLRREMTDDSTANYNATAINTRLIPSIGTSAEGASYDYLDTPGYGTFIYQLEEVEVSGRKSLHPFAEVTILPQLDISVDDQSKINLSYRAIPGWNYEIQFKELGDLEEEWQALPNSPHNDGLVVEDGAEGGDRLYRLTASSVE